MSVKYEKMEKLVLAKTRHILLTGGKEAGMSVDVTIEINFITFSSTNW